VVVVVVHAFFLQRGVEERSRSSGHAAYVGVVVVADFGA
jgi:hypothetical protein